MPCPLCKSYIRLKAEPQKQLAQKTDDQGFFDTILGLAAILFLGGIACVVYFFFFYNTSVKDPDGTFDFNIGLLNQRECGIIIGVGATLVGCFVGIFFAIVKAVGFIEDAVAKVSNR